MILEGAVVKVDGKFYKALSGECCGACVFNGKECEVKGSDDLCDFLRVRSGMSWYFEEVV